MSREYRPEPNPSEKPVDPEYRTWETVEAFLNENEQSLKNRVTVDTRRFLMHTPIFGLRTLAAYEELTGWLPDDKKTNFAEQESLQDFKNKLTEELTSKDEREFLDALAILSDLRSSGLIEKKEVRVAKPDMDKITEIILGLLGAENPGTGNLALAFRDTAVLIRNGLFDEIRPEKRKVIYSKLRELSGESIARSLSQINYHRQRRWFDSSLEGMNVYASLSIPVPAAILHTF